MKFNEWLEKDYPKLLTSAKKIHKNPRDLINHTYIRVHKQNLKNVMKNPLAYFRKAMFIEGTRGVFKKMYQLTEPPEYTHVSNYDISNAIKKEEVDIMTNHLSWFDRTVLQLYLDGWNLTEVSKSTNIKVSVLHTSVHRSKQKLKDVLS